MTNFLTRRIVGLIRKEFIVIARDKGTIAMLVLLPILLLTLFGFAIKLDPKHLPTTIISYDHSPLTRNFISNLEASKYFKVTDTSNNVAKKNEEFATGKISFAITIKPNFTREYIRGNNPAMLVEIDGSDPGSSASALSNIEPIINRSIDRFNQAGLTNAKQNTITHNIKLIIHRLYNETNSSAFNIVPGLIGVLLTVTLTMLTATAITSEHESGTMEMLLSTPLNPIEIILGKVVPYVLLGYLQLTSILIFNSLLIHLKMEGSFVVLYLATAPFIIANLMVGMIFSTIAKTPMQAMQLSVFFQLPSIFLTGYIFSFFGMPLWARAIGYCLPMTYYNRITRGILLKGNDWMQVLPNIWPIILIAFILVILTGKIFKTTLD